MHPVSVLTLHARLWFLGRAHLRCASMRVWSPLSLNRYVCGVRNAVIRSLTVLSTSANQESVSSSVYPIKSSAHHLAVSNSRHRLHLLRRADDQLMGQLPLLHLLRTSSAYRSVPFALIPSYDSDFPLAIDAGDALCSLENSATPSLTALPISALAVKTPPVEIRYPTFLDKRQNAADPPVCFNMCLMPSITRAVSSAL